MARTVVLRFAGDAGPLMRTLGEVDARIHSAFAGINSAGASMQNAGRSMSLAVTAPLALVAKKSIGTAIDYERSMNMLRAVSGATGDQMGELGKLAIALGADVTLPGTSAADAAEAMTELAKAGLDVGQVMGATKGVLQLSAAGGLSNAAAAEVAANALNAFGLKGEETGRVASLLAAAANASSSEVTDLADSLKMGASVFAQAGIPIEDFIASVAMMSNEGIAGSDAGTSLKTMLQRLQNPTGEAADVMKQLGINVYDAQGRMVPFRALVEQFSRATAGLTQKQRDHAIATIFGADAVRGANAVLTAGVGKFDAMKKNVSEEGAAAKLAAARNEGLGGAIDALGSTLETFSLAIMLPLLPVLERWVERLTEIIGHISTLDPAVHRMGLAITGAAAAVGPLLYGFGFLLKHLTPLRLGFALLGLAITAALNPEKVGQMLDEVSEKFGELAPKVMSTLSTVARAIGEWIVMNGPVIAREFAFWADAFVRWIGPMIPPLLTKLGEVAVAIGQWAITQVPVLVAQLWQWAQAFLDWIGPMIPPFLERLGGIILAMGAWVHANLPLIGAMLLSWAQAFVDWIAPLIPWLVEKLGPILVAIREWVTMEAVPWLAKALQTWIPAFTDWLKDVVPPLLLGLVALTGVITKWVLTEAMPAVARVMAQLGVGIVVGLMNAMLPAITAAINFALGLLNKGLDLLDKAAGPLVNFGEIGKVDLGQINAAGLIDRIGQTTMNPFDMGGGAPADANRAGAWEGGGGGDWAAPSNSNTTNNIYMQGEPDPMHVASEIAWASYH